MPDEELKSRCSASQAQLSASPSKEDQTAMGDAGRSLFTEVKLLREQVQQLCAAVRALVQLQSVLNQGVQQLLKRDGGANVEVI